MTPQPQAHLPRPVHREPPAHAPNAALLIDFDNVTMAIRSDLQTELKRLLQSDIIRGKVAVQRAYADWRRYQQYVVPLAESSIDLIFAPAYGSNKKNATDIRLAIDALELVFTRPEIGTFILLSGDSDFSALVLKLKEYGKYVIGVGIRESSSDLLIQNCDEYYSYNELAGFTKESDVTYVRRDPWELVVEAVKQMTAHNDVMRSDRLKQVMQEIDPTFDEKDAGFSRFSKFVVEAAHKGLIHLTKLDNGQYEIALGAGVPGAAAQPAFPGVEAPRESDDRSQRGGSRRRSEDGRTRRGAAAEMIDLPKEDDEAFAVTLGEEVRPAPAPEPVGAPDLDEANDPPMPASSAPPSMRPAQPPAGGGVPSRGARFRRGSRGGHRAAPPEIQQIGVVEMDPNFKPRVELVPTRPPAIEPTAAGSDSPRAPTEENRRERAGRGGGQGGQGGRGRRGGGGGGGAPRGADAIQGDGGGERGERGGGGARGGRGRGGRERPPTEERGADEHAAAFRAPAPPPPALSPPSPPAAPAAEPDVEGESFWSKVKRGLTGGA